MEGKIHMKNAPIKAAKTKHLVYFGLVSSKVSLFQIIWLFWYAE